MEELPDPSFVEGTAKLVERFAIALPDGDVGALEDPGFVGWLNEHAEDAPFGHGGATRLDRSVRNARRLAARGNAAITGFDPVTVIGEVEAALSPRFHLEATLVDVILYPDGGSFARHKDTPRTEALVGTLIAPVSARAVVGSPRVFFARRLYERLSSTMNASSTSAQSRLW